MAIYLTLKLEQIIVFVGAFVNIKIWQAKANRCLGFWRTLSGEKNVLITLEGF